MSNNTVFDPTNMALRRESYFAFVRSMRSFMFTDNGDYQPATEKDMRITSWIMPALLTSPDAADRDFALVLYRAWPCWDTYEVFTSSGIATVMARHCKELSPELRRRSEEHLAKFTVAENGRKPSAAIFDYMFHGYNDNMPAMATRQMVLAGDILNRKDFTDAGLFHLEGLCAHLTRRGLASEFTSATYTPINLCALLDIAELTSNTEAREMAQACANRMALDLLSHWHWPTGTTGGAMSRAYTIDKTETLSNLNAYIWYISGHPLTIDPAEALHDDTFPGVMHHSRNRGFNIAQYVEFMNGTHAGISGDIKKFVNTPQTYPREVYATSDIGQTGSLTGCCGIQTRSFQMPHYWIATMAPSGWSQSTPLHGVLASKKELQGWRDRVAFWHSVILNQPDYGDCPSWSKDPRVEEDGVDDLGYYQTAQKAGSVLMLGSISPNCDGKEAHKLKFSLLFGTLFCMPDEMFDGNVKLNAWEGIATPATWQFLRFDTVYVAIRMAGLVDTQPISLIRAVKNRYLRLELPFIEDKSVVIDQKYRAFTEFGLVMEIASKEEVGSFEKFRQQVSLTTWEYFHSFYRNSRYCGRHGELQIIDSVTSGTARFIAVDGKVEEPRFFEATGLDPALTQLFGDNRTIRQRRISYRPDFPASPFYPELKYQVLAADIQGEESVPTST